MADMAQPAPPASPNLRPFLLPLAVGLAILLLWQGLITLFAVPPFLVPTPLSVIAAFGTRTGTILAALAYTVGSTVAGLSLALALSLVMASLFTWSPATSRALLPLIVILRTAPVLAIAPILILIFGRGLATSIAVVVLVSFFPMMVNAAKGFRSTKANALELMRVAGATWGQTFWKVRFPYALPFIFTGIRMASAGAVLSAMLAEWLSGAPGLGTLILQASSFRDLPLMWAGVVTAMAAASALYVLTTRAEGRLAR
jgi:ABC-type nitrate/sulfonate/bicarbonate transport system permease component